MAEGPGTQSMPGAHRQSWKLSSHVLCCRPRAQPCRRGLGLLPSQEPEPGPGPSAWDKPRMFRLCSRQGASKDGGAGAGAFATQSQRADGQPAHCCHGPRCARGGPLGEPAAACRTKPSTRSAPVSGSPEAMGGCRRGEASPAHTPPGGLGVGGHDRGHAEGHGVCERGTSGRVWGRMGTQWALQELPPFLGPRPLASPALEPPWALKLPDPVSRSQHPHLPWCLPG